MSERTFTVKKKENVWTINYTRNDPGTPHLDALGVLMRTTPDDAVLIWPKCGQIAAVQGGKVKSREKKARGGRQGRNKFF